MVTDGVPVIPEGVPGYPGVGGEKTTGVTVTVATSGVLMPVSVGTVYTIVKGGKDPELEPPPGETVAVTTDTAGLLGVARPVTVKTGTVTVLTKGVTAVTTDGPPKTVEGPVGFPETVIVKAEAEDVKGEEMTVMIAGVPMIEEAVDNVVQDVSIDPGEPKEPASESVTVMTRGVAVEESCASVTVTMPWSVAVLVQVVSTETSRASLEAC